MAMVRPPKFNVKRIVFERDNYTCQKCGLVGESGNRRGCVQVHHIKPRRDGGTNDIDNLVTLCYDCHKEIGTALGRPTVSPDGELAVRMSITIPYEMVEWIKANGNGNASAGVRAAVQFAWDVERAEAEAEALAPTYNGGRW